MRPVTGFFALLVGVLLAPAVHAQPIDPVREAQERALANQIAAQRDAADRRAIDAERDAEVVRQRQETEQRLQSLGAQRAQPVTEPTPPPTVSSGRAPTTKPSQDKP